MENYDKAVAELIDRYVYAVTKRLPEAQRADIEKELRGLIDDMLMSRTKGTAPSASDAEAILRELGRPSTLAAKYRGSEQYLIGPEYFDIYIMIVKIVVTVAACATAFALVIGYATSPPANLWQAIGSFFASAVSSAVSAFAVVTFVFAMIERYADKKVKSKGIEWKPSDLPPVPVEKAVIKKSEPIVGIVFAVIGIVIFNFAPWLFGAGDLSGRTFIPVFDLGILTGMLPLIDALFLISILKETARLAIGRYDFRLASIVSVLNVVYLIVFLYVFAPPAIWNPGFIQSLNAAYGWGWTVTAEAAAAWSIAIRVIIGLTIFGVIVDTITTIVRSFRHRDTRKPV
jgi:hypothetical protein